MGLQTKILYYYFCFFFDKLFLNDFFSFFSVISEHGGKPWLSDYNDDNFLSGRKAMKRGNDILF